MKASRLIFGDHDKWTLPIMHDKWTLPVMQDEGRTCERRTGAFPGVMHCYSLWFGGQVTKHKSAVNTVLRNEASSKNRSHKINTPFFLHVWECNTLWNVTQKTWICFYNLFSPPLLKRVKSIVNSAIAFKMHSRTRIRYKMIFSTCSYLSYPKVDTYNGVN